MKYNIVFSIPVHEKPEVVFDTILNYTYFNSNCAIVLHIAQKFDFNNGCIDKETFFRKLSSFKNVFINPKSVRTGYGDIIQAHIANYQYIKDVIDFDYIALGASNDLFIKKGLYDYISPYRAGLKIIPIDEDKTWIAAYKAKEDLDLARMLNDITGKEPIIYRSQVEGCFFKKDLFDKMCDLITLHYNYEKTDPKKMYAREEVYFPSLAMMLEKKEDVLLDNYTYNSVKSPSWTVYSSDILRILSQDLPYFCVKRVDRDLNNPIRRYIRDELGGYGDELKSYAPQAQEYCSGDISNYEKKRKVLDIRLGIIALIKNSLKRIKPIRDYIGKHKERP